MHVYQFVQMIIDVSEMHSTGEIGNESSVCSWNMGYLQIEMNPPYCKREVKVQRRLKEDQKCTSHIHCIMDFAV